MEVWANEPSVQLQAQLPGLMPERAQWRNTVHCPSTSQHAQKLGGTVGSILQRFGFDRAAASNACLRCGPALTYSIGQPELADRSAAAGPVRWKSGTLDLTVMAHLGAGRIGSAPAVLQCATGQNL